VGHFKATECKPVAFFVDFLRQQTSGRFTQSRQLRTNEQPRALEAAPLQVARLTLC